jgi:hypothetical protein
MIKSLAYAKPASIISFFKIAHASILIAIAKLSMAALNASLTSLLTHMGIARLVTLIALLPITIDACHAIADTLLLFLASATSYLLIVLQPTWKVMPVLHAFPIFV